MADYPALNHIPIGMLLAIGDPWRIEETLQSGDPGQIAELASAFQQAGGCTEETWAEWTQARERFHASWNRENGVHPIDDSAEVQRATTQLFVQNDQLPLIAVDLQNIAADLVSAESQSGSQGRHAQRNAGVSGHADRPCSCRRRGLLGLSRPGGGIDHGGAD